MYVINREIIQICWAKTFVSTVSSLELFQNGALSDVITQVADQQYPTSGKSSGHQRERLEQNNQAEAINVNFLL